MTDVRLVVGLDAPGIVEALGDYGDPYPALLCSYAYYKPFRKTQDKLYYRDWTLDSGAYTAFTCGKKIILQDYIDFCKEISDKDPKLSEIVALDVIGDWKSSLKNCEEMWKQGIEAMPTYHLGEPAHVLRTLCATYPKVGISGYTQLKGEKSKKSYTDAVFGIAWENGAKKLHGLGLGTENIIKAYPWHSVDASSWLLGPLKFGVFKTVGNKNLGLRNNHKRNIRREVEHWLRIEKHNKEVWCKELKSME